MSEQNPVLNNPYEEPALHCARNLIHGQIDRHPGNVWEAREQYLAKHGPFTEDFEMPERRVDLDRLRPNPLDD